MPLTLVVEKGEPAGVAFGLKQGETILGRSSSAGVHLLSADISGTHAKVTVTGDKAVLENVSRFGTLVDNVEITGPVTLKPGQRIGVGKATVLLVNGEVGSDTPADAPATRGTLAAGPASSATRPLQSLARPLQPPTHDEAATGKGVPVKPVGRADDRTRAMPSGGGDAEPLSRPDWTTEAGGEGETRAMQTRAASPEEIEVLKVTEQKKVSRQITLGLIIAIPVLIRLYVVWPKSLPPEKEFSWPRTAAGDYMDAFEPSPSGSAKEGGFDVCFPGTPGFTKKSIPGGLSIECRLGRELNIPMKIILQEEVDKKFTGMSRIEMVKDWMQQLSSGGGNWNFDNPSPSVNYIGKEKGLATIRVTYQRDGDGSWFGVATVFRHGTRRISLRAEAPAAERVRAERVLSAQFIRPSLEFGRTCWEPSNAQATLADEDILREVRQELDRLAPGTWGEAESLLSTLLTRAAQSGKQDLESEAVGLLSKLREREALWFNSQQLAFDAAIMQGNNKKAGKIAEFCKGVFSSTEDQRYYTVRKWRTEP